MKKQKQQTSVFPSPFLSPANSSFPFTEVDSAGKQQVHLLSKGALFMFRL